MRLDTIRIAVQNITIEGLILEFGVFKGRTIRLISQLLPNNTIYGFDSFEGLPDDWYGKYIKGTFNLMGKIPRFPKNVEIVKGRFEETLENFLDDMPYEVAFVNFDADLYLSTKFVLETLVEKERIVKGTVLYFDEFVSKNYSDELRAFMETGIPVKLLSYWWEDQNTGFAFKVL